MDSDYIGYVLPSPTMCEHTIMFTQVFLYISYDIPMKWEPSGSVNDWCGFRVTTAPQVVLFMKAVHLQPPDAPSTQPDLMIWDQWIDEASPNVQTILKYMLPTVANRALMYALHGVHMQMNRASVVRGYAYKGNLPEIGGVLQFMRQCWGQESCTCSQRTLGREGISG